MRRATTCSRWSIGSRGPARRDHRSHGQAAAQARDGARASWPSFDDVREGGRRGRRRDRRRHHARGPGDDGQAGHRGGRAVRARRLRPGGGGDPAVRVRRQRRRSRGGNRAHEARCSPRAGATRLAVSRDEAERLRFWSGRKAAFPAVGRISPDYYCMDGTIPRKRLGEVLNFIGAMEKKYGLRCPNVFHAGDGNLHPLILFDANDAGPAASAPRPSRAEVLEKCVEVGGTITGEHGVGVEKIDQMCVQFGAGELEAFHAIKRVFDPKGLLNPGKAVPAAVALRRIRPQAREGRAIAAIPDCRAFEPGRPPGANPGGGARRGAALRIRGGGTQGFLRQSRRAASRSTRAATPASSTTSRRNSWSPPAAEHPWLKFRKILDKENQMLAFEPPHFGPGATLGGCVAAGLSGPRRASAGSVRDFDARRENSRRARAAARVRRTGDEERRRLRRVAPARRVAGHARPDRRGVAEGAAAAAGEELTLRFRNAAGEGAGGTAPLGRTAAADLGQRAGTTANWRCDCRAPRARCAPQRKIWAARAMPAEEAARFWTGVREHTDPFFAGDAPLWRLSLPSQAPRGRPPGRAAAGVGRRAALAAVGAGRRGRACGGRARGRPRNAVSRRGQAAGCVRPAAAAARAPAPGPEAKLRSGGHPQSRPAVRGVLGLEQLPFQRFGRRARRRGECRRRIPREQPRVQLDRERGLAGFAGLVGGLEEQFLLRHAVAGGGRRAGGCEGDRTGIAKRCRRGGRCFDEPVFSALAARKLAMRASSASCRSLDLRRTYQTSPTAVRTKAATTSQNKPFMRKV